MEETTKFILKKCINVYVVMCVGGQTRTTRNKIQQK